MPGCHVTDRRKRLFIILKKTHAIDVAAAKAGFSRATGYRLAHDPSLPSKESPPRGWRTLEWRTRAWRAEHGPEREVVFRQKHEPGHRGFPDFPHMGSLGVTVAGQPLDHMLYHFRLARSGFTHARVVLGGESFTALAEGLQGALRHLGGAPREHRTDSLSAAFCNLRKDEADDMTERYRALCAHYSMTVSRNNRAWRTRTGRSKGRTATSNVRSPTHSLCAAPRTSTISTPTVPSSPRSLAAPTPLTGPSASRPSAWFCATCRRCAADYEETGVVLTSSSGFTLRRVFYTVPSRLIGHRLGVRLYDDRLELFLGGTRHLTLPRGRAGATGPHMHMVNYRHVIHSLKKKPIALLSLVYRDALFPRESCRLAVTLLALAHEENCEAELAAEIDQALKAGWATRPDRLKARFAPDPAQICPGSTWPSRICPAADPCQAWEARHDREGRRAGKQPQQGRCHQTLPDARRSPPADDQPAVAELRQAGQHRGLDRGPLPRRARRARTRRT